VAVLNELMAPGVIAHQLPRGVPSGIGGYKLYVKGYRTVIPDAHFTIADVVAEGDMVALRWITSGTHKGRLAILPQFRPTGKKVTMGGMTFLRFNASGKIVECWANTDPLALMQETGTFPLSL